MSQSSPLLYPARCLKNPDDGQAVALEVRPLFLHRDVMERAARIAPGELVNRNTAKLALKSAVRPWLPDALIDRQKQGFAMPLPEWLGGDSEIGRMLRVANTPTPAHELLDLTRIAEFGRAHSLGRADFTPMVYAVFALDKWFAHWMPS